MTLLLESSKELKSQLLIGYTACNRDRSYRRGIFSAQIWGIQFYSPLLRCFWRTNGSTCTTVPARPFPNWCENSMATWSSSRMMAEDWSYRLWLEDRQFWLIPRLPVPWSGSLFYQSQEFLSLLVMRLPALTSCMISLAGDHKERTSPTTRSTSVLLLLCTDF